MSIDAPSAGEPIEEQITAPRHAVRELAKWAYAAAYYDGQTSLDELIALPVVGELVSEIHDLNRAREERDDFSNFDSL